MYKVSVHPQSENKKRLQKFFFFYKVVLFVYPIRLLFAFSNLSKPHMYETYYEKPQTFVGPNTPKLQYMVSELCSQRLNYRHGRRFREITKKKQITWISEKETRKIRLHVILSYAISTAAISTVYTFNRSHFQPLAFSTACKFNRLQIQPLANSTATNSTYLIKFKVIQFFQDVRKQVK